MVTPLPLDAELHRQVHPDLLMMDGSVMSSAFIPKPSDQDKLSTRQGTLMTPQEALEFHIRLGYQSVGTWSFFVSDAAPAVALDDSAGNDAHASVCFDHCPSRRARDRLGKQIKAHAKQTYAPAA